MIPDPKIFDGSIRLTHKKKQLIMKVRDKNFYLMCQETTRRNPEPRVLLNQKINEVDSNKVYKFLISDQQLRCDLTDLILLRSDNYVWFNDKKLKTRGFFFPLNSVRSMFNSCKKRMI